MDQHAIRTLTSQLADDLGWLEEHCRQQPDQAPQAGQLRLAAALVRNCVGPFLEGQAPVPLHVAVVGGAGAGKSTVANFLSGAAEAEANPQAGFTRHPIAYAGANGQLSWPTQLGFLGPLQRLDQPSPSNLDADVYQLRHVPGRPPDDGGFSLLQRFVVWDCPDMTTWAAAGYIPRLLEVAGLADVIVYVASDERYNDEVPTQFLHMLLQTNKPVVVCLVKVKEENAPQLIAHFQEEVLGRMTSAALAVLPVPYLTPEQLADPVRLAGKYRVPLLNQVMVLGEPAAAARRRTVQGAVHYLVHSQDSLLAAARKDVAALQSWREVVQAGQAEFDQRYKREYLTGEKFHSFDEALVRLMELLELPGVGKFVSGTLWVLRTPYRLLKGAFTKALQRPAAAGRPELPVLEGALAGWLDLLRKEAARRAGTHPVWEHIDKGFATGLTDVAQERFQQGFRGFQASLADEIEQTARAIYGELEKNPAKLNMLRGFKFSLEAGSIGVTVATGGIGLHDLILVPVIASLTHQLVELLGMQYVDGQRELARHRQQALVTQYVSGPLAEWLAQWPATGGSTYERLQLALRRIPPAARQLATLVQEQPSHAT